jgi:hypothetical protein
MDAEERTSSQDGISCLFSEVDDVFTFDDFFITNSEDGTAVSFRFCVYHNICFESKVCFGGELPSSASVSSTLFAIGMCSLLWYWMGFATPTIRISAAVAGKCHLDQSALHYWMWFYEVAILEFCFVNKIKHSVDIVVDHETGLSATAVLQMLHHEEDERATVGKDTEGRNHAIVPIGG